MIPILLLLLSCIGYAQPGKYAGTKKAMIGKTYTDSRTIPGMRGWVMKEGALLNSISDPEFIYASVHQKGTTCVVIVAINEDTASSVSTIVDVLEITGVQKGWSIRIASCYSGNEQDNYLIVWGKDNKEEYMKLMKKAWRFDADKRRITTWPLKYIRCENIGC